MSAAMPPGWCEIDPGHCMRASRALRVRAFCHKQTGTPASWAWHVETWTGVTVASGFRFRRVHACELADAVITVLAGQSR